MEAMPIGASKWVPFTLLACLAFTKVAATEYSANPDISHLYAAGSFAKSKETVRVEMVPAKFTLNRFGSSVPTLKPDPEAASALPHLKYMALRGLGDLPAMLLECSGMAYRATYYTRKDFSEVKPTLEFGRLPVLEIAGNEISQSNAIVRFLAEKSSLAGADELEKARVDSLYETFRDLYVSHGTWGSSFNVVVLKAGPADGEQLVHFRDTSNKGDFSPFQKASAALKTFDDLLAVSTSGYLVGSNLTYVDLALWQKLHEVGQEDGLGPGWADRLGVPHLGRFVSNIYHNNQCLSSFVGSGRRMPRIRRVDKDYVYLSDSQVIPVPVVPKLGSSPIYSDTREL
jgi:glutathione S-transferase